MQVGIPMLVLGWVPYVSDGLGWILSWMIWLQNWITFTIQLLPGGNLERLTISIFGMVFVWVLYIEWANWEWGDRKQMVYLTIFLFLIWSGDRLMQEIDRPSEELLIFSGEKGLLMDFKVGSTHLSWNQDFAPEQISFSIEPNRIAEHRPQFPESAKAFEKNKGLWFPVFDFQFDPEGRKFFWNNRNPIRVEEIFQTESKELTASDSLPATQGAFRIVF